MSLVETNREVTFVAEVSNIPLPVQNFCGKIDKNFNATADALFARATELRHAADELDERANRLIAASPDLRTQIEQWIKYERESNERQLSLALVKP